MDEDPRVRVHDVIDALFDRRYVRVGRDYCRYIGKDFEHVDERHYGVPGHKWTGCTLGDIVDMVMESKDAVVIEPVFDLKLPKAMEALDRYKTVQGRDMMWGKASYITIDPHKPLTVIDQSTGKAMKIEDIPKMRWRVVE